MTITPWASEVKEFRARRRYSQGGRGGKGGKISPQRHRGHKGEKMQGPSAKVTEERGQWLVDYPSLI
jgi:hypothetical protein